ncbi:MAG: HAD family phosphatase [Gammaproteobacteria bacterium]|nr:HAD family phosphatase [Gammaproteobacteria bacterium]
MAQYTHLLFDHDGVLVDTEPLYFEATRKCLAPLGVELALDHYLALMVDGASPWEMARPLGATDKDIEHWRAQRNVFYQELLVSEPIEIEGVEAVLAKLRERYRIAIVTTAKPEDFALIHRNRNIVPFADFVLTRETYQRSKPHPDPYLAALARYGIGPGNALAIEDSQRGLRAAVAAGLDCAVVHHPFTATQDFSLATYRVASLSELAEQILGQT